MKKTCLILIISGLLFAQVQGASIILNEFNAVESDEFLGGGNSGKVDTYFGRVEGNGGNWIELVVVQDHLDIRGWELRWIEDDGESNGTAVWDPGRSSWSQGAITFNVAAELWSDLRGGTIITISEKKTLDTEYENGGPVSFDLSTDVSFDPFAPEPDWTVHVSTRDEQEKGAAGLLSTVTNVIDDNPGDFSVGKDDWELRIYDGTSTNFGPIGEAIADWGGGGISSKEVGRLEEDPSASIGLGGYDDATSSTFGTANEYGGVYQDFSSLRAWVPEPTSLLLMAGAGLLALKGRRKRAR